MNLPHSSHTPDPRADADPLDGADNRPDGGVAFRDTQHVPVLPAEIVHWLDPQPGQIVVDATLGGGGHTRLLAERLGPQGRILAIDRDPLPVARAAAATWPCQVEPIAGSYTQLGEFLADRGLTAVDAIVMDLGLSSDQLADVERGFSFRVDGPLDLRFNPAHGEPAWQLLQYLPEKELADLIYEFGEERLSRRIARRIVEQRRRQPIRTTTELANLVRACYPPRASRGGRNRPVIDPATRTFQALRIAVNSELQHLKTALADYPNYLKPGGRLAVISFHSLEDRMVKQAFRDDHRWEVLTRKPLEASDEELAVNPRARSAKLRVAARAVDDR